MRIWEQFAEHILGEMIKGLHLHPAVAALLVAGLVAGFVRWVWPWTKISSQTMSHAKQWVIGLGLLSIAFGCVLAIAIMHRQ